MTPRLQYHVVEIERARRILEDEWQHIQSDLGPFIDGNQALQVREVLSGPEKTYRYILVTAAISKATDVGIHCRSLQQRSSLPGSYDARSVAHKVVVPFEKAHGERLGGSNEPYLNKPARFPEFSMENPNRNIRAQKRLFDLLEWCQDYVGNNPERARDLLRQVLVEVQSLPPKDYGIQISATGDIFVDVVQAVRLYLSESSGGERLSAVTAALLSVLMQDRTVKAYPVNWPDEFADTAGDIEIFADESLVGAAEVKDKPLLGSDVQHCVKKALQKKLREYFIVYGQRISEGQESEIQRIVKEATIHGLDLYLLEAPRMHELILALCGKEGRRRFLGAMGHYLGQINASNDSRNAWIEITKEYLA